MTASVDMAGNSWTNVYGNVSARIARFQAPSSEDELQGVVARAARDGLNVRVAGGAHSHTPVVATDGVIVDLGNMPAEIRVDADLHRATAPAGSRLRDVFDPLWDAGVALKNVGEVQDPTVAGSVSTAVHGTGVELPCISASVCGVRLVTAAGDVVNVSADDAEVLRAARVSVGMLGVITELTLEVLPRYELEEHMFFMNVDEALDRWDELVYGHRHYSFYYLPNPQSSQMYAKQVPRPPQDSGEVCHALVRDISSPGEPATGGPGRRRDRMNRILIFEFEPNYMEIEYAIPIEEGKATFLEVRELARARYPERILPIDVRFTASDDAYLSPFQGGAKVVVSVATDPTDGYMTVLDDFEAILASHGGRPHWGKLHSLTRTRAKQIYPELEKFEDIRRRFDPDGIFLNDHLRELFA